ncbi:MAG: CoA transferase [Dehalococcoidia bacterium]|nr:CoA transferase [Dehalococcoidia bacterium]
MDIPQKVKGLVKKTTPVLSERFGPLKRIRVLSTGNMIAGPHAAALMADFGAEVIHIETPGVGDKMRTVGPFIAQDGKKVSTLWADNARNRLSMELDLHINKNHKSKEVFLGLVKSSDIWIDNLFQLEQEYGITDKLMLETNPKLVIVHVSCYGKPEFGGNPDKCQRPADDLIGQAYSCWTNLNGSPDAPPIRIAPYSASYISAATACIGALIGYIHAKKSGIGQVVDAAEFESVAHTLMDHFSCYLNINHLQHRFGNKQDNLNPYDIFKTTDGYIAIGVLGPGLFRKFMLAMKEAVGLNPEDYPFTEVSVTREAVSSPKGMELDRITRDWIGSHTKKEVDALFEKYDVAAGIIYTAQDAAEDKHWVDRNNFVECVDQTIQKKVKIFGIAPKFSQTPGKVWRGAPALGQDTDDILSKILDYTPDEISQLREEKIV